jgi:hypothetical protein
VDVVVRVALQALPQQLHHRADAQGSVSCLHLVASVERRLEITEVEGIAPAPRRAGRFDHLLRAEVVDVEPVLASAFLEIRLAEEAPGVVADQEGEVGLLPKIGGVDRPPLQDRPGRAESERRVAPGARVDPEGCVNRAR